MPDEVRRLEDGFKLYGQNYKAVTKHVRTKSYQAVYPQIRKLVMEQQLKENSRKGYRPIPTKPKKSKSKEDINVSDEVRKQFLMACSFINVQQQNDLKYLLE